jgi:hypothetical protein
MQDQYHDLVDPHHDPQVSVTLLTEPFFFDKQFCMAKTVIYTLDITFQSNQKKIFQLRQKFIIIIFSAKANVNF